MTSFAVRSFGCRVNQAEAFGWVEELRKGGLRLEEDPGRGDYLLVNSCTLTGRADRDVRRFIQRAARDNPRARIVVAGCFSGRASDELRRLPGVWLVVPNDAKRGLAARVIEAAGGRKDGTADAAGAVPFRARAFLKAQDGCDFICAYCVIPGVRGKSVSVAGDEVIGRVRELVGDGYREIVLAGIHLGSYGRDLEPRSSLRGLLERIEAVEGLGRVRLSSLDPRFCDEPLAAHIAASPRVAPHFHLSLQSGSARTLRAMGRGSSPESYMDILTDLRRRAPDAALGADIIVGFPGETDDDFERTRGFLERSPLTYFHVFPFSPREGTPAAEMEPVDGAIKAARADLLRDLSRAKDLAFRAGFVGRELEAVVITKKGRGSEARRRALDGRDGGNAFGTAQLPGSGGDRRNRRAGGGGEPSREGNVGNSDPGGDVVKNVSGGAIAATGGSGVEVLTGNNISVAVPDCEAPRREFVMVRITEATADSTIGVAVP
jgi:threonylcarbamoyladenosine tRNA methylthiotransferase MtaB